MLNTLFGFKKQMTSAYDARGRRVGVSVVEVRPNSITQIKLSERDGYSALQLGVGNKKSVRKPQQGHLKKAGVKETTRFLREVRTEESGQLGEEVVVSQVFKKGDAVKVTGVSKGKGFQGGVRRHGFHGGPKTHGQSDRHRAPGSIGTGTTPGRVLKGKKMAGHMGVDQVSIKNLEVIQVDKANNLLVLKGAVPGPVGGLLRIENIGKIKGYIAPPEEKEDEEEVSSQESVAGSQAENEKVAEQEGVEKAEAKVEAQKEETENAES